MKPRVFTVPPGQAFAPAFARGFWARHGGDPLRVARTAILVNTPRSLRLVEEALADAAGGSALLPRLDTLTALGGDPLAVDLPPAVAPLRRRLKLLRLVEAWLAAEGRPPPAAPALAAALAELMDALDEAGVAAEALADATEGQHAAHWDETLRFLEIVRRTWPDIRATEEGGAPDPRARQRAAVEARIAGWAAAPPAAPVIGAGSTGAVASTGALLAAIARLPEGAVVLPGLDRDLAPDVWARIAAAARGAPGGAPEHPQAPFAGVLLALGLEPGDVEPWEPEAAAAPVPARRRLLAEALRPAPVSDAWAEALPALADEAETATQGLALLEAPGPRAEAAAVALAIREALDVPGRRVALVTPDAGLARRVTAELARFAVTPDDSLGRPLAQTPPGVFLRLVLAIAEGSAGGPELAAFLSHPLMRAGGDRVGHLALARRYETGVLRKPMARPGPGRLPRRRPPAPARLAAETAAEARARALRDAAETRWLDAIEAAVAPLASALGRDAPLAETLAAHRTAAETLSGPAPASVGPGGEADAEDPASPPGGPVLDVDGPPSAAGAGQPSVYAVRGAGDPAAAADAAAEAGALAAGPAPNPATPPESHGAAAGAGPALWRGADGVAAEALLATLAREAGAHEGAMREYPALLATLLSEEEVRPDPAQPHPRVTILGPREARNAEADLVILSGLVDGTWPALPGADPWLSRPMRRALGLPAPETRVGLSAHDFFHAACRGEVLMTRALRVEGTPVLPSRWLTRLANLLGGIDEGAPLRALRARGARLAVAAAALHGPGPARPRAPRPMPRPDPAARPRRLSVTEIETLVRDAYAIYARRVLGLEPLDPPGRPLDARDRGIAVHTLLERFVDETRDALPPPETARARLLAIADEVLGAEVPEPDLRRIWRARVARFADWFVAGEAERRRAGVPLGLETKGALELETPGGPFTLSAMADRIDLAHGGGGVILDYKTGAPPTESQIKTGFALQLQLQGAILAAGGFGNLGAIEPLGGAYLGLTGSGEGGKEVWVDLAGTAGEARAKLLALLAAYDRADTPYLSRGRMQFTGDAGVYDHLARRDEWEGGEE